MLDVAGYHAQRPGITEALLSVAVDHDGGTPYEWLAEPLPATGRVLDLACGSAPMADLVGTRRYVGVDASPAEVAAAARRRPAATVVLGDARQPPVAPPCAAVTLSMALMLLPLPGLLPGVTRLLAPGGVLAATVPLRGDAVAGTPYGAVLEAVGTLHEPYPEPLHDLARRMAGHGLDVAGDAIRRFARPVRDDGDVALVAASFYAGVRGAARARDLVAGMVGGALEYPIRRVVAVRRP